MPGLRGGMHTRMTKGVADAVFKTLRRYGLIKLRQRTAFVQCQTDACRDYMLNTSRRIVFRSHDWHVQCETEVGTLTRLSIAVCNLRLTAMYEYWTEDAPAQRVARR